MAWVSGQLVDAADAARPVQSVIVWTEGEDDERTKTLLLLTLLLRCCQDPGLSSTKRSSGPAVASLDRRSLSKPEVAADPADE